MRQMEESIFLAVKDITIFTLIERIPRGEESATGPTKKSYQLKPTWKQLVRGYLMTGILRTLGLRKTKFGN